MSSFFLIFLYYWGQTLCCNGLYCIERHIWMNVRYNFMLYLQTELIGYIWTQTHSLSPHTSSRYTNTYRWVVWLSGFLWGQSSSGWSPRTEELSALREFYCQRMFKGISVSVSVEMLHRGEWSEKININTQKFCNVMSVNCTQHLSVCDVLHPNKPKGQEIKKRLKSTSSRGKLLLSYV